MNQPSATLIMQELQSLRTEVSELKSILTSQNDPQIGFTVEKESKPNNTKPEESFDSRITNLLLELKIPPNINGYSMIREAIKLAYNNRKMLVVTKFLYPKLAEMFDTTSPRVERAIRHAIEVSYNNRKGYFHPLYQNGFQDERPTNGQFIALIVDKFKLEDQDELVKVGI